MRFWFENAADDLVGLKKMLAPGFERRADLSRWFAFL
jgi:hypothetical protein